MMIKFTMRSLQLLKTSNKILSVNLTFKFKQFLRGNRQNRIKRYKAIPDYNPELLFVNKDKVLYVNILSLFYCVNKALRIEYSIICG